jgi:gamma-glutamyltranspeptidase
MPPITQDVSNLTALKGWYTLVKTENIDVSSCRSSQRYHTLTEMMKLESHDARAHVADVAFSHEMEWPPNETHTPQRTIHPNDHTRANMRIVILYDVSPSGTVLISSIAMETPSAS